MQFQKINRSVCATQQILPPASPAPVLTGHGLLVVISAIAAVVVVCLLAILCSFIVGLGALGGFFVLASILLLVRRFRPVTEPKKDIPVEMARQEKLPKGVQSVTETKKDIPVEMAWQENSSEDVWPVNEPKKDTSMEMARQEKLPVDIPQEKPVSSAEGSLFRQLTDAEKTAIKDAFQRCFMAMSAVPGASCYGKSGSHAQNILTSLDTLFTQSHTESEWHIITNELEICALTRRDGGCQDRLNVLLLGMHTCVILAGTSILQSPHLVVTTLRAQYLYELIEEFIRTVFSNYVALTNNRSDEALEASLVLHCIIMRLYPDIAKELPQCMTHAECGWSILQNICDEKFFKSDKNPAIVECFGKRCVDMAAAFKSLEDAEKIDAEIDGIAESFNWMTKNSIATVIKSVLYFVSGQMNKNFNGIMAQYAKTMRINDEEITPCKCEQYDEIVQSLRENSKILMGVKSYASTHPRAPVTKKIFSAANIDLSSLTFADFEVLWFFCDQKCDEHENDLATQLKYENLRDAIAEYFSQKNTLQSRYIMKLLCKANDELAQPFDHFYLESNWRSVVS